MVFVQGCPHHCPGCHNPQSHSFEGGRETGVEELFREIRSDPLLRGVTFSGGEPFCQPGPLAELAEQVHGIGLDVTSYTGYRYEELLAMHNTDVDRLLDRTDVLIDGPFLLAQRDLSLRFRGSGNQRIIDMNATRRCGKPVVLHLEED